MPGPKHWGNAFPIACEGKRQSPIDIDSKSVVVDASLEPIAASYDANDVKQIVNTGASFRVDVDGSGSGRAILELDLVRSFPYPSSNSRK